MVRAGLAPMRRNRLNAGPRPLAPQVPIISLAIAILLAALPVVVKHGWWPSLGLLTLLSWRMLRQDAWPAWAAAPMGLLNDLVTGSPLGMSMALWPAIMLAMDVIDRRTAFRGYRVEWIVAAAFIFVYKLAQWRIAASGGAPVPFDEMLPGMVVTILAFVPVSALVRRLDRWRLGR